MRKKLIFSLLAIVILAFPLINFKDQQKTVTIKPPVNPVAQLILNESFGTTSLRVTKSFNWNAEKLIWSFKVTSPHAANIEVFTLNSPARIVVDVHGTTWKAVSYDVGAVGLSKVRIGSHPDKVRIVFDLPGDEAPNLYSRAEEGGSLLIATAN